MSGIERNILTFSVNKLELSQSDLSRILYLMSVERTLVVVFRIYKFYIVIETFPSNYKDSFLMVSLYLEVIL